MTDNQATREQVAREFIDKFTRETMHSDYTVIEADDRDQLVIDLAALLASTERRVLEEAAAIAKRNTYMSKTADDGGDFGGPASCEYGCGDVIAELLLREAQERTP